MHLRYIVLMAIATLAASSSVTSAAKSVHDSRTPTVATNTQVETTNTAHADHEFVRSLLEDDDNSATQGQAFVEHKLKKTLTNPKKAKKLYQYWYKQGYTAEQVASDLGQTENRELDPTYKKISSDYAAYIKKQSA
ncbi:hypothetical protein F442_03823 [Phytophthora nicotianae P10297]|uniref:RxLR effector protein n=2 Tax=Phytophthora nicotianae TaxID=4792 RepID=V9FQV1_PHYNI|nr:hypothetical protein F443_03836 [Phytophthora nicotianae P1569]ETP50959.1 hypothetical protein F442_03823 [Phytophthora nicotianae P10297]